jgi:hypothetical protein
MVRSVCVWLMSLPASAPNTTPVREWSVPESYG